MLDLNHPELATEKDIACGLQYWAKLFKAETWEDLHMLSSEYEVLSKHIKIMKKNNLSKDTVITDLMESFEISKDKATALVNEHWR